MIMSLPLTLSQFADPACDACAVAMGGVGCASCLKDHHESEVLRESQELLLNKVAEQPRLLHYWQEDFQVMAQAAATRRADQRNVSSSNDPQLVYPLSSSR